MAQQKTVVVIGAGIIGLQNSVCLLQAGFRVINLAKHLPGQESVHEYTSPWAGAHWRTHAPANDLRQCHWDIMTYNHWLKAIEEEKITGTQDSGLAVRLSTLIWDSPDHNELHGGIRSLWWRDQVRNFHVIGDDRPEQLPKSAVVARFDGIAVNVPKHLGYLMQKIRKLGGEVVEAALPLDKGITGLLDHATKIVGESGINTTNLSFVNAIGINASRLCGNQKMFPIRGQVVVVKGEAATITTRHGIDCDGKAYIAYAIPRPGSGTTVLGGCNQKHSWEAEEDEDMTQSILNRARDLVPELMSGEGNDENRAWEIMRVCVGFRPAREGGARVELEEIDGKSLVHAYGHAGAGFQNSFGVAQDVVSLLEQGTKSR